MLACFSRWKYSSKTGAVLERGRERERETERLLGSNRLNKTAVREEVTFGLNAVIARSTSVTFSCLPAAACAKVQIICDRAPHPDTTSTHIHMDAYKICSSILSNSARGMEIRWCNAPLSVRGFSFRGDPSTSQRSSAVYCCCVPFRRMSDVGGCRIDATAGGRRAGL